MFWKTVAPIGLMSWGLFYVTASIISPEQRREDRLQTQARQYLTRALPPILNGFKFEEWQKRSTSELLLSAKQAELRKSFKDMKVRYGPLRKIEVPVVSVGVDDIRGREVPWATFRAMASFRYGEAPVVGKIVYRAGGWKLQQFSIRTDIGIFQPGQEDDGL